MKNKSVFRCFLVVFLVAIFVLNLSLSMNVSANDIVKPTLKKVFLDYTCLDSFATQIEDLSIGEEIEVNIEVIGTNKKLVPYAPVNAFEWIDYGTQELNKLSDNITLSERMEKGRYLLTYRFKVLDPLKGAITFQPSTDIEKPDRKIMIKSSSCINVGDSEFIPLVLNAITPPPPRIGTRKPVVLLVDFSDRIRGSSVDFFQSLLFSKTSSKYSMRDYFYDVSYSLLDVNGTTYGWIRLPQTFAYYNYYTDSNWNPHFDDFINDVITRSDPLVNYANHDGNNDGYIDGIIIIYAGQVDSPWAKGLWPCSGGLNYTLDGKRTDRYTVQNEFDSTLGDTDISVFCHEYSHAMGARDFYDYDDSSNGLGYWSLMAFDSKQYLDPWHRYYMGWVSPVVISSLGNYTVNYAEGPSNTNSVYKIWINTPNEYFLIENRQKTGWDSILPGSGLLIYHIDESVTTDNDKEWYPPDHMSSGHYFCALEQADGRWDLERNSNNGDEGDPWPGSTNKTSFGNSSTPNSNSYSGAITNIIVSDISSSSQVMTARMGMDFSGSGWIKTIGTSGYDDWLIPVQQTSDNGYIIAGSTSHVDIDYADCLIVKLDAQGNKIWSKTLGLSGYVDWFASVQQTSDGGYIAGGKISSAAGRDCLIVKLDSNGNKEWVKTLGLSGYDESCFSVQQTSDRGYIVGANVKSIGSNLYSFLITKLDSNGNKEWAKITGGYEYDDDELNYIPRVKQTAENEFVLVGCTKDTDSLGGGPDTVLIKLNGVGNILWAKQYDINANFVFDIQKTSDGGYVIAGKTKSWLSSTDEDCLIVKLDSFGNVTWAKKYFGLETEEFLSIKQTSDSGYVATGNTWSFDINNGDGIILKVDSEGNKTWAKKVGKNSYEERACSIQQTSDNGYIIAGSTSHVDIDYADCLIVKVKNDGNIPDNSCEYLEDVTSSISVSSLSSSVINLSPTVTVPAVELNSLDLDLTSIDMECQTICGQASSGLTLTQPNGGETLTGGTTYPIQWTSAGLTTGCIRILFYDGSSWSTVATGLPLSQTSYSWTVPNINASGCKIRVGNYDTSTDNWIVYDDSNSTFTITQDAGDTPTEAVSLTTDGTVHTDNFSKIGDVDWYKFTAVAGKTYTIDTLNLGARCNTVIELYAPDGTTFIDYNNDFDSLASRIDFECPQGKSGTYYIKVRSYNSNTFGTDTNYDIRVYPALKISFSPEFCLRNTPTNVTVTVTQDGNPISGASVYNTFTGTTLTTNSSGQAVFNINRSSGGNVFYVTYSNYKRCYSYFWVLYSTSYGLIEVKPVDKNGYYLTNYILSTYYLSGSQYYGYYTNWWSGYNSTFRLPSTSGNALVTLKKDQYYSNGTPYYMVKQASIVGNSKTSLPFNAQTETATLNLTGQYNGSPLSYARVTVRNQGFNYEESYDVGYTDSSGSEMLYVTPGTYTAVLAQDNRNGTTPDVVLCATNINASYNTTNTISYTSSQLGTLNRHAYDGNENEIELYLEGRTNNTGFYTYSTGETLLLSPSTYQWDYAEGNIYNYPDDWWYSFIPSETSTVTPGSTQTINFGGSLTCNITTDKSNYSQGETVNIKVRVNDAYSHPLDRVYHSNYSSSSDVSQTKEPSRDIIPNLHSHLLGEQGEEGGNPYLAPDFDIEENALNSYYEYPYIHLVVKDPSNTTVVDISNYDFWYLRENGYNYTLPSTAPNGTYTISASFNTGPYQGVITKSTTFSVTSGTTFTLRIPTGWSVISVPFTTPASTITSNPNVQYLLTWNGSFWNTATTLNPGEGYLVYNASSTTINIELTGTPTVSPFTMPATGNYQMIGNPFTKACTLSSTSTITYLLSWNGSFWQPADPNNLQPGRGYLIKTAVSGTFTFIQNP